MFYAGLMWVSRLSVMFAAYYPFVWFKSVDFDNPLGSIIDLVITHWLSRSPCLYVMSHTVSRLVPLPSTSGPQLNTVSCHRIAVPFLMAAEYLFAEYYFVDLDYRPLATHIHPILSICTRSFCVSGMSSQESECHDCDKHQQHQHPWTLMAGPTFGEPQVSPQNVQIRQARIWPDVVHSSEISHIYDIPIIIIVLDPSKFFNELPIIDNLIH